MTLRILPRFKGPREFVSLNDSRFHAIFRLLIDQFIRIMVMIHVIWLAACISPKNTATPEPAPTAVTMPARTATPIYPWTDENAVMSGICFEAANDATGQVFVLRDAEAHIRFYEGVDNSQLCRRPVTRYPFDFSGGRVLAGLWSAGRGCTARHDVLSIEQDDAARKLLIRLRFVAEGNCDYELVRPFWIGLDGVQDYQIAIQVQ